jgi:hypothetical protein
VDSLGNWSADKASYALDSKVDSLGNWSGDKADYALDSKVDSLGNWSADKVSYLLIADLVWSNISGRPVNLSQFVNDLNVTAVSGSCSVGSYVEAINANGSLNCSVPAGGGANYTHLSNFTDDIGASDGNVLANWANITGVITHLSNLTDNLGSRGYTHLSNFTNNLASMGSFNETSSINYTTSGTVAVFANGCSQVANSSGVYFVC